MNTSTLEFASFFMFCVKQLLPSAVCPEQQVTQLSGRSSELKTHMLVSPPTQCSALSPPECHLAPGPDLLISERQIPQQLVLGTTLGHCFVTENRSYEDNFSCQIVDLTIPRVFVQLPALFPYSDQQKWAGSKTFMSSNLVNSFVTKS